MNKTANYLLSGGIECLNCSSTRLKRGPVSTLGMKATRSVDCQQCGSSWEDQMSLEVSGVRNMLDYGVGTVLYSLKAELDCDENDNERITAPGSEWTVKSVNVNGLGQMTTSRVIHCAATGAWITPEVTSLNRDFAFMGDHRLLYFVDADMEIRNPTISECGRFACDPSVYGFKPYSDSVMTLTLPEDAGTLTLTKIGDDFDLIRKNAKGEVLARAKVSDIKSSMEEDDEAATTEHPLAPVAKAGGPVIVKCTDDLGNISYLKQAPQGHWFAVLSSGIAASLSHCGILGDEVGFFMQLKRTTSPEQALNLVKSRGAVRRYTYELA
jgi:hypothetical protein